MMMLIAFALAGMAAPASPAPRAVRPSVSRTAAVQGRVSYRTGAERVEKPDARAKVWVFRGRQELALQNLAKLRQFEKQFPQGLTRIEDRPKEDQTRMAAMVLMSYAMVHADSLRATVPVRADGGFELPWDGKEPLTVLVESQATIGSYHMPRYAVIPLSTGGRAAPLRIDFGVSHLESHPK